MIALCCAENMLTLGRVPFARSVMFSDTNHHRLATNGVACRLQRPCMLPIDRLALGGLGPRSSSPLLWLWHTLNQFKNRSAWPGIFLVFEFGYRGHVSAIMIPKF